MPETSIGDFVRLPLELEIPANLPTRYATNIVVQHSRHEFVVSFFEAVPPFAFGTVEEKKALIQSMGSVRAECVARIVIAPGRMPDFIRALQENWQRYESTLRPENSEAGI